MLFQNFHNGVTFICNYVKIITLCRSINISFLSLIFCVAAHMTDAECLYFWHLNSLQTAIVYIISFSGRTDINCLQRKLQHL